MRQINPKTVGRGAARAVRGAPMTAKQREQLSTVLRALGRLGGKASAAKLTKAERVAKARKAGLAKGRKKKRGGRP